LSIKWIEGYAYSHRLKNVQHALNGGEFTIPGTRIRVDGFHRASNTIFEFHGDDWHGNPNKHKPMKKCHPHSNKNAKQLYRETLEREKEIKRLGYNLIIMWESDYKQRLKRWVTHETRYCLKFSQHVPNSKL
jgi:G:T-mismatch repair DNA endonuclease (very short patch repair protein)